MKVVVGLERAITRLLKGLVQFYRLFFSAWLGAGCRFTPTCSGYALQALDRHGALAGSYLAAHRLLRCHPGCQGGIDEVPPALHALWGRSPKDGPFISRADGPPPSATDKSSSPASPSPEIAP